MATRSAKREPLCGLAERVLDNVFEASSSEQWAKLLRAPLEKAALKGDRGMALKLTEAGAEVGSALQEAVRGGHGEIISYLLDNGAPINDKDRHGSAPLHIAAEVDNAEMIRLLLRKGADKDTLDAQGNTALHVAACLGHSSATASLLAGGADAGVQNSDEKLPLHVAAMKGHVDVLRAMIEHGVHVGVGDHEGSTALHLSSYYGRLEMIDVLVAAGADINARDNFGETSLHAAVEGATDQEAVVLALLNHGAEVNTKTLRLEATPLYYAVLDDALHQGTAQVVDVLLRWGADETMVNANGNTPADAVDAGIKEHDCVHADIVEQVRKLLANAPADRAWRRRGYLTMCRAHPDRLQLKQDHPATDANVMPRAGSEAKVARIKENSMRDPGGGGTTGCEISGCDWMDAVAKVVSFKEEGVFRTVVGYL